MPLLEMKLFFCYSKSYKLLKYEKEMFSRPYFALRFAPMWNPTAQHPVTCIINLKKNILLTLIIEIIRPTNLLSFSFHCLLCPLTFKETKISSDF